MECEIQNEERASSQHSPDGVVLGYRLLRCGHPAPVLVMLHGLASNLTRWSEFVAHTSLRGGWDLLRLDLRGHGTSMCRGSLTRRQWCEDVSTLLVAEGYKQAVLAGHSLGAQVAMEFACNYPERCAGLVLIDPVFPTAIRGSLGWARRLRGLIFLAVRLSWAADALGLGRKRFPLRDLHALDEQTRRQMKAGGADIARLYTDPLADLPYLPFANYLQDLREVTRPLPDISSIQVPVLVLLSRGGAVSQREQTLLQLSRLAQAEVHTINAEHWLLTERPEEARAAIDQWCQCRFNA